MPAAIDHLNRRRVVRSRRVIDGPIGNVDDRFPICQFLNGYRADLEFALEETRQDLYDWRKRHAEALKRELEARALVAEADAEIRRLTRRMEMIATRLLNAPPWQRED